MGVVEVVLVFRSPSRTDSRRRHRRLPLARRQKLELQRGWTEEKGRVRRAADDALRRAEEGRARAEVEATQEVCCRCIAPYVTVTTTIGRGMAWCMRAARRRLKVTLKRSSVFFPCCRPPSLEFASAVFITVLPFTVSKGEPLPVETLLRLAGSI